MPVLDSDLIRFASYEEPISRLRLVFRTGQVRAYDGVPKAAYEGLMKAPSAGHYFEQHIRERFRCTELGF